MKRYKLVIEYEGSAYCGWQKQKKLPSIQQTLEAAIEKFSGEKVQVHAAGRTDAGVHALGQVVHFDFTNIGQHPPKTIMDAINFHLRRNRISVQSVAEVTEDFHARYSAKMRYYKYIILARMSPPVIDRHCWHVKAELSLDEIKRGAQYLIGTHDFSSFRAANCQSKSPIKTIEEISVEKKEQNIIIHIKAISFLHHMVRNIVGTLKLVGTGRIPAEAIEIILESKDRGKAGPTAPAQGLFFVKVDYSKK
jgi:tRNA pseudouridine38-40 synthase